MSITSKRIITVGILFIIVLPIIILARQFVPMGVQTLRLNKAAAQKEKTLSQLQLLSDQGTVANGEVDGDWLTADPNPNVSTFAKARFTTDTTLATAETDIGANLQKVGFVREGTATGPFYKIYRNSGAYLNQSEDYTGIALRYTRGNEVILARYAFDKLYACPAAKTCEHTAGSKPIDDIYDIRAYASLPVKDISVIYADQTYYQTQL